MIYATEYSENQTLVFRRDKSVTCGIIKLNRVTGTLELNGESVDTILKTSDWYRLSSNEEKENG